MSVLVCGWFCTWGTGRLFDPEEFCGFYDAQAIALLDGRLDVPPAAIGSEAFVFQGKSYGYFGIGPALLRLPLVIAFDGMDGRWSRLMMMIASTTNVLCAYGILRLLRGDRGDPSTEEKWLHSLFVLCAGIGSTNIFLVARSFTFHEALMWAGTFALLFTWLLLKYLARPSRATLALMGLFAFLSFSSRPTVGAGTLLALGVLLIVLLWGIARKASTAKPRWGFDWPANPLHHALITAAILGVSVGVYFGVIYGKFRSFNGVPLQYYYYYKLMPQRMQLAGGKQIHLENIPTSVVNYFFSRGFEIWSSFPWFERTRRAIFVGHPAMDMIDGFSSFPTSMPALTLLAAIGVYAVFRGQSDATRRLRLPAIALTLGGAIVLTTVALCERYLHDFYPALLVLGAAGVCQIATGRSARRMTVLLAILTAFSVAVNCAFAINHQRLTTGAPPEKIAEFRHWQESIDALIHRGRAQ